MSEIDIEQLATQRAIIKTDRVCPACGADTAWPVDKHVFIDGYRVAEKELQSLRDVVENQTGEILNLHNELAKLKEDLNLEKKVCEDFESEAKKWRQSAQELYSENEKLKEENDRFKLIAKFPQSQIEADLRKERNNFKQERNQARWWAKQWRLLVESLRRASVRQEVAIKIAEQRDQALTELSAFSEDIETERQAFLSEHDENVRLHNQLEEVIDLLDQINSAFYCRTSKKEWLALMEKTKPMIQNVRAKYFNYKKAKDELDAANSKTVRTDSEPESSRKEEGKS